MTEDKQAPQPNHPPAWLPIIALLLLFAAGAWLKNRTVTPTQFLWIAGVAISLGLLVILGYVELIVGRFLGFKSGTWAVGVALAIVGYVCHSDAVNAVNKLFHVDASALPMTVAAGTALNMFAFFAPAMGGAFVVSVVIGATMAFERWTSDDPNEQIARWAAVIAAAVFSGFAYLVAHYQLSEEGMRPKLYRIAQGTDFSGSYDCEGRDPAYFSALFIGPDQRKVLFAPALPDPELMERIDGRAPILQPVKIPDRFEVTECVAPEWPLEGFDEKGFKLP